MADSKVSSDWYVMSEKDRRSAQILLDADGDNEVICFHCQQAVEKSIKGYLVSQTGMLQDGHNLSKLVLKTMQYEPGFQQYKKDAAFLNSYYMETRYPSDDPMLISSEDVMECMRIMDRILLAVGQAGKSSL
jgi:HEPN domain-containing protein